MRGHGLSTNKTQKDTLNLQNTSADIVHDIYSRNISELTIIAHGCSGKLAMTIASHHPEIVKNLILINTSPYSTVPDNLGNPQAWIYQKIKECLNLTFPSKYSNKED